MKLAPRFFRLYNISISSKAKIRTMVVCTAFSVLNEERGCDQRDRIISFRRACRVALTCNCFLVFEALTNTKCCYNILIKLLYLVVVWWGKAGLDCFNSLHS